MTQDELKALVEEQGKAWKNFRDENDKRIAQIEKSGAASATVVENVEKLNTRLDEIGKQVSKVQGETNARLDTLAINGGNIENPTVVASRLVAFNAMRADSRKAPVEQAALTAYNAAFDHFVKFGSDGMNTEMRNSLSVGQESSGGVWVKPDTTGPMQKKLYESSPMRQVASVVSISTDAIEGLIDNDELTTGWVSEKADRPETTTPEVGKYRIPTYEQYAAPRITQQLLEDSQFDVEGWLTDKVAEKMGRTENTAFVSGNGSGKPRGFLDYTKNTTDDATRAWDAIQYFATGTSGAFAASGPADKLLDVMYGLKAGYREGAVWLGARSTLATIRKLKDGQNNYLVSPKFTDSGFIETIWNTPFVSAEDMPVIAANSYSLAYGNFKKAYLIVDRLGVTLLRDPYTAKPYVIFYMRKRVGGGLVNGEAIKLVKFGAS